MVVTAVHWLQDPFYGIQVTVHVATKAEVS
jgi:hypothetical protein